MIDTYDGHRSSHVRSFLTSAAVLGIAVATILTVGVIARASAAYGDVTTITNQASLVSGKSIIADEQLISMAQSSLHGALTNQASLVSGESIIADEQSISMAQLNLNGALVASNSPTDGAFK
jgi:carbonic anhydrase/acetyltransferase-like protein (isoleucine patch superfamily)